MSQLRCHIRYIRIKSLTSPYILNFYYIIWLTIINGNENLLKTKATSNTVINFQPAFKFRRLFRRRVVNELVHFERPQPVNYGLADPSHAENSHGGPLEGGPTHPHGLPRTPSVAGQDYMFKLFSNNYIVYINKKLRF